MTKSPSYLSAAALIGASLVVSMPAAATNKSPSKAFGEPKSDQALVYFVRSAHFVAKARTMFVYADEAFLGVLDNDTYTFAYVEPGKRLLWLNWAKISEEVELEAGEVYYFDVFDTFNALDPESAKEYVEAAKFYVTPDDKERATSAQHIQERHGKAVRVAETKPDQEYVGSERKREEHVAKWPRVDLEGYDALYVEDFAMKDPKAAERKQEHVVESAPRRLAQAIVDALGEGVFERVHRGAAPEGAAGAVVLRGEILQYKPGSEGARLMMAGTGSAQLDFGAQLLAADSQRVMARLDGERTWAWGGARGASRGIDDIERNVAYEIALYLKRCRGVDGAAAEPADEAASDR